MFQKQAKENRDFHWNMITMLAIKEEWSGVIS